MPDGLQRLWRTFFDIDQILGILPEMLMVGVPNTLLLAFVAVVIGTIIGLVVAMMLISRNAAIRVPARTFVDVFRGLPVILTIYLIGQGLPIAGIRIFGQSSYAYAAFALGLIEGAYISEIFRSGIQSVERGQMEASRSLGMSYFETMRWVIVPQGIRRVLPALTGQFIHIIKGSSLVYLLGLLPDQREIFSIASDASHISGTLSPMVAAGLVYLCLTIPLTYAVNAFDRRLRDGARRPIEPASLQTQQA
jgi:His/Glu/Gln/Arg/opine family amino acid ABC transporter permease subunit